MGVDEAVLRKIEVAHRVAHWVVQLFLNVGLEPHFELE